jgi:hypothetical protein
MRKKLQERWKSGKLNFFLEYKTDQKPKKLSMDFLVKHTLFYVTFLLF